jgi:predicted PurR-regulated permease PerM
MTVGEQARWWGLAGLVLVIVLWALGDAVTPFLAGMAIAYFLDPLADRLEARGASRLLATVIITALALTAAAAILIVLVPLVIDQAVQVVRAAPVYLATLQDFIETRVLPAGSQALGGPDALDRAFDDFAARAQAWSVALLGRAWTSGLAVIDALALAVITPVVAFYMLLDWDRMVAEIDRQLPLRHAAAIRRVAAEIDRTLARFVRGQLTVCLILGAFYAAALLLVGLNFGLLIGMFAGLISFIPFVGSIFGGLLSIGVATFQFWNEPIWILAVAAIFVAGQAVEGNVLTPKLVGGSVGLHPVWLMFALSAFGVMMGFTGLLIAVPAAAVIGVLARFGLERYRQGRLFLGGEPLAPAEREPRR